MMTAIADVPFAYTAHSWNHRSAPQWGQVTHLSDGHPWMRTALRKITELVEMPENWDGYGSCRIQQSAHRKATSIISELLSKTSMPAPQIFPVPGGGIQFEWQMAHGGAELEILPNGSMEYLIEDSSGEMREGVATDNEVMRLIRWLEYKEKSIATF